MSAINACGAGQLKVCLAPLAVIEAPYAVYPSIEAAVATHIYRRPDKCEDNLVKSLIVPEPTATGIALWCLKDSISLSM